MKAMTSLVAADCTFLCRLFTGWEGFVVAQGRAGRSRAVRAGWAAISSTMPRSSKTAGAAAPEASE